MKILAIVCCILPISAFSQDITGVWTGYLKTPGSQLAYELGITQTNKKLTAYSLIIYPKDGIENVGIKNAKIKQGKKDILIEDGALIYENFTTPPKRVKMYCSLNLVKKDTSLILQGSFKTRSLDFTDTRTYEGEVYLQKSGNPLSSKMLITFEELKLPFNPSFTTITNKKNVKQPVSEIPAYKKGNNTIPGSGVTQKTNPANRKIEKISEVFFSSDSLQLSVYDNGVIDGDTISMVLNGKIIAEKIGLTAKAFKITIPALIKQGDSLLLVMNAESLGLIPPNTGLLIIQDGATRHEIRYEGDLQKSSSVMLRKKRE